MPCANPCLQCPDFTGAGRDQDGPTADQALPIAKLVLGGMACDSTAGNQVFHSASWGRRSSCLAMRLSSGKHGEHTGSIWLRHRVAFGQAALSTLVAALFLCWPNLRHSEA